MTEHVIINTDSRDLHFIPDESINMIVTSPPYPMIEMWDGLFAAQDNTIVSDINKGCTQIAFEKMHNVLNATWNECNRVLKQGGFVCINIGDAVRTINGTFQMYSNHTKVIEFFTKLGYNLLPDIIWHKQTNAPNKFMGSGMYPAGAYVTYEHEYIIILRKGAKRQFTNEEKVQRTRSAYFFEERNEWFSDLWEFNGVLQEMPYDTDRKRSAAYPFEIPYRLINMYTLENDTILDPFCGLGTTNLACMYTNRNSIGIEINAGIASLAHNRLNKVTIADINSYIDRRISKHKHYIERLTVDKKAKCYKNIVYGFPVKTKYETHIEFKKVEQMLKKSEKIILY